MDNINIIELRSTQNLNDANDLLKKGWKFINTHTISDEYGSYVLYVLGKPKNAD